MAVRPGVWPNTPFSCGAELGPDGADPGEVGGVEDVIQASDLAPSSGFEPIEELLLRMAE